MLPGQGYCATMGTVMGAYGTMAELGRQKSNMKHKRSNRRLLLTKRSGRSILICDPIYVDM